MIFTRWSHFHRPIHADVAVQLPAEYRFLAVIPESLAPTAEAANRAVGVAKAVLAGKTDSIDMLSDSVDLQADNFRRAMHPEEGQPMRPE